MRYIVLLLACALTLACGNGTANRDPKAFPLSVPPAPPAITTLAPDATPVNSVPFTLTVNGNNFGNDAVVFWNGSPLSTRFIMPNQLIASVTQTNLLLAGMVQVYVHTEGLNSNTVDFDLTIQ